MDIFDAAFLKARDLLDLASRHTVNAVEFSKARLQLAQLRAEVRKAYERMGRLWYEQAKTQADNNDLLSTCAADLEALLEEIAELEQVLASARCEATCQRCGSANAPEALYCQRCGAALFKDSIFGDFDADDADDDGK